MSRVEEHTIKSEVLGAERNYTVFLPAGYDIDKEKTYPVLYLLHGMDGTNKDWFDRGHVKDVMDQLTASGEADAMIIVSPDAGGSVREGKWNGYFVEDERTPGPADATSNALLAEALKEILDTLTEREADVLKMRFGMYDGRTHTLEEVGQIFGVTRERIRQIENKAIRKLRHPSRAKKIRDFYC